MNLVAKEFAASQVDRPGVLLLSRFTGAAEDLDGYLEVNPYDPEAFARRIRDALTLPLEERRERIERLIASQRTIYDWMADIIRVWGSVRRRKRVLKPAPAPPDAPPDSDDLA